jgi:prophage regulatory protein
LVDVNGIYTLKGKRGFMSDVLRLPRVLGKSGLGKSSLYNLISSGQFPRPFSLGGGRAVGWLESDVNAWIEARAAAGAAKTAEALAK